MDESGDVESYHSAAAARHLSRIDDTFVEHLLGLLPGSGSRGGSLWGLDIGTGPAQIPVKVLERVPGMKIIGIDRSPNMLACARRNAEQAGVSGKLLLLAGDGHELPFPDGRFAVVLCNSMLHHARDPLRLLREVARVASPGAALLLRDLRRPARGLLQWHLWRHGRHYRGRMRELFEDSVRAAYTAEELEGFLSQANLPRARVFRFRGAHIGIQQQAET